LQDEVTLNVKGYSEETFLVLDDKTHMQGLWGRVSRQTSGTICMTYVKMKLCRDGLGRGHHCMGDDETTEYTYGRVFGG
jgi:hypothetical protein